MGLYIQSPKNQKPKQISFEEARGGYISLKFGLSPSKNFYYYLLQW